MNGLLTPIAEEIFFIFSLKNEKIEMESGNFDN